MDIQQKILNLIEKTDFIEVEVEQDGLCVKARKRALKKKSKNGDATTHNHVVVCSQWVGTFLSHAVGAGDWVEKGQTLGTVMVFDIPIDVEAEVDGKVLSIYVGNNQVVEYNQPLFEIETKGEKEGKK
ncbi:MAG: biotin/lipoyl-containing protein [bacterium]